MVLHCPVCHSKYTVEDLIREGIRDDFIDLASYFGRGWLIVNEYIESFRGSQWASVGEKKRLRVLQEIKNLFETCEFQFEKKRYRTDRKSIYGAIKVIVDKEMIKLKDHNYLKQILIDPFDGTPNVVKAQRVSAEGLTAKEEAKKIEGQRLRKSEVLEEEEITGAEYLKRHDISSLLDKVGKTI